MRLTKFKVMNFRSVSDSGWVEVDGVTALIGVNESGKTNLLLPLWKLNPAQEGEIQPTSDYPKKMFGEIRAEPERYPFIIAEFATGDRKVEVAEAAGINEESAEVVRVTRNFDGSYKVDFPDFERRAALPFAEVEKSIAELKDDIGKVRLFKQEKDLKPKVDELIQAELDGAKGKVGPDGLSALREALEAVIPPMPAKTSSLVPRIQQTVDYLQDMYEELTAAAPSDREEVTDAIVGMLPKFVYYSNYGNLDSEIYLPHVVDNLNRDDLGAKEAAKARTLRVLFRFVRLSPEEILELGRDFDQNQQGREPTNEEIAEIADKKRERSILLQSAETTLTTQFRDWWRQGDYRFELQADGNHFRIWVSDDRRPEKIELESRSTGLQWFLSFYLVFLVESLGEHKDAVLLLDEPGLSLHPLAQRDLSSFFDNLAKTNGIIYTAHSPFLIDADRIERARKVYVATDGTTKATSNLRHIEDDDEQPGAAYAVHSALGLTVAESLLIGCRPVIVEGASDQHYLTTIKSLLIAGGKIAPRRELVFPPAGGAKTTKIVASILTGRDEELPVVLLDGDEAGRRMANDLTKGIYGDAPSKILSTDDFAGYEKSEVEDLFPSRFLADTVDRWQRGPEVLFGDVVKEGGSVVPQIERWAENEKFQLPKYWKVELAKRVKQRALDAGLDGFDQSTVDKWQRLFEAFEQ
ncbi:MAG: AAA family ATPase [Gammaproteobacteria bacterium]|nr:AAA family ATPase [Gammaproteobacteria bacterium]MYF00434.1 AAA family ATPase [Gammaproteobacteria bacterium]